MKFNKLKSAALSVLCICLFTIVAGAADTGRIIYSTHLNDVVLRDIAVDRHGKVYVTGLSSQGTIFVAKLDRAGKVLYSTYIGEPLAGGNAGGAGGGYGIAVDWRGNAYVTGATGGGLPTTPDAYQKNPGNGEACPSPAGGPSSGDAFVIKLSRSGELVYATYLGGDCIDYGTAIAVDFWGNAYVTGLTTGAFPTTPSAINNNTTCSEFCGFVAKLDATGSSLVYSDYLGTFDVYPHDIAVDLSGHAYVIGTTNTGFTTTPDAFQPNWPGTVSTRFEPFVTKLNADGSSFAYSTYLGGKVCDAFGCNGGGQGNGVAIAVDLRGNAYVTGSHTIGFPTTPNTVQPNFGGGATDAFVAKLDCTGSALIYSTYLGGVAAEQGNDVAVDLRGRAYVLWGSTTTPDAKVSRLNKSGSYLVNFGIGTPQAAQNVKLAIDYSGDLYVATIDGSVIKISTRRFRDEDLSIDTDEEQMDFR